MIVLRGLYKNFGEHRVLRGVNLEIRDGETLVIMGRSGGGKTILLKLILGLLKPDRGSIEIDGLDLRRLKREELWELQQRFGILFQGAALFDSLTVEGNVAFGLYARHPKSDPEKIREIVKERLRWVGLKGIEKLYPASLSGGMKKRVGLARALATDPQYLLYDEPTTGIDPVMAEAINELIISLKQRLRKTSVVVTHDIHSAYKIADRLAMLYEGEIIEVGAPQQIQSSSNPVVQQFIHGRLAGPIKLEV